MNQVLTFRKFIYLLLINFLFQISQTQFYNRRTKCSANQFIFSVQWANFMMNMQYSPAALTQFYQLLSVGDQIYHFGLKVTQTSTEQANKQYNQCKNFYMHQNICCHYSKIDSLINTTLQGYLNSYYQAKFPIIDLLYKIYDQNKKHPNCSNFSPFYLPGIDGYTYANATQNIVNIMNKIQTQIQIIQNYELQQIKNGLCLFCLGIQDFKTFIYPPDPNNNLSRAFLINQQYFNNITNMIATSMWNISQTANQIQNFISNQLSGFINQNMTNNTNCIKIINYLTNKTQVQKRMICRSFNHCLQFAETYFGTPGASSYMKVFDNYNRFQNMGVTYNRILVDNELGFQGNTTYQPYNQTVPPIIADIRGVSFSPFS